MVIKEDEFENILESILKETSKYYPNFNKKDENLIKKAFKFSKESHAGQKRASGSPYFIHPLKATKYLLPIKPDIETIVACLLHDVIEDTPKTAHDIEETFGKEIRILCEGVEKITKVRLEKDETQYQYDSLQKLFVAVAQDIRIIFIKLADRIHNLKTLEFLPATKHERIVKESLEIYVPVANRLGLFEFKTQIEDLCFRNQQPLIYQQIRKDVSAYKKQKLQFFEEVKQELLDTLNHEKISITDITGRQKSITSVYKKMKKKNFSSASELYDIFGFRIITKSIEECYQILGILHTHWNPMPGTFKDYIAVPKTNDYQSLHTTLLGIAKSHLPIEIQIRTEQMHADAEYGPAAHWAYKATKHSHFDEDYVNKTSWFPQNVPLEKKDKDPKEFFKEISKSILADLIYVFTRTGDIKTLPIKSTPVDLAYNIHSEIGDTCVGARVNGNIKPLNYQLHNGDIVEILTKKGRTPNPAWLDFIKSSTAKSHIKNSLNKIKHSNGLSLIIPEKREDQQLITIVEKKIPFKAKKSDFSVVIGREKNISYKLAKCCNPLPGKDILAYNSRGLESVIHTNDCKQLKKLDPKRFCEAHFILRKKFQTTSKDRHGLMRDFTSEISNFSVSIWDVKIDHKPNNIASNIFTVDAISEKEFQELLTKLKKIQGVLSIKELTKKSVPIKK